MSKLSKIKNAKVEGFIDDALEMNTTVGPRVWENTTQWGYDDIGRDIPPIVPLPDNAFRPRSEIPDLHPWEQKARLVEDFDKYAHYRILRNRRETSSNQSYYDDLYREKRDIAWLPIMSGFIGGVTANVVTNFINTITEYIDPNSKTNRLTRLEQQQINHAKALREIKGITSDMAKLVEELGDEIMSTRRDQLKLARMIPEVIFPSNAIIRSIRLASERLDEVIDTYVETGKVDLKNIGLLLNNTHLEKQHSWRDTVFDNFMVGQGDTILFEFTALQRSEDTHAYQTDAFDYWDNLTEPTIIKRRHEGEQHMIFNHTSNCVRHIPKPKLRAINEECSTTNYDDGHLDDWKIIQTISDFDEIKPSAQVKSTATYNYIYCFPYNITMDNIGTLRCPYKPFKLSQNIGFCTINKHHRSSMVNMKIFQQYDQYGFEAMHHSHLEQSTDLENDLKLIQTARDHCQMEKTQPP